MVMSQGGQQIAELPAANAGEVCCGMLSERRDGHCQEPAAMSAMLDPTAPTGLLTARNATRLRSQEH